MLSKRKTSRKELKNGSLALLKVITKTIINFYDDL